MIFQDKFCITFSHPARKRHFQKEKKKTVSLLLLDYGWKYAFWNSLVNNQILHVFLDVIHTCNMYTHTHTRTHILHEDSVLDKTNN